MSKVTIGNRTYLIGQMPPREQLHMLRRIIPVFGPALPAAMQLLDKDVPKDQALAELASMIGPMTTALANMSDQQLDYVMDSCLARVQVLDGEKAYALYVNGQRMYQDIDLGGELQLCSEVIKANLSGFFAQLSAVSASSLSVNTEAQPV